MAYKITDACISCGACEAECPVSCISQAMITCYKPDECIECGHVQMFVQLMSVQD